MTPTRNISESASAMKNNTLQVSDRVERIKPSATLAVSAKAEELQAAGKNIINLGVGEPDFDTPEFIKEATIQAIREGHTKYTAVEGIKSLKQAIIHKFMRDNKLQYELNQIIASCGAKHSFYNLFAAILNPGDEVIIPAPYWVSYPDMVLLNDGKPVIVQSDFEHQFKLTPAQLEAAMTERTRMLIINSPSNPTGMAYSADELKALGEVLLRYPQVLIASDDIYECNMWNHLPFTNILNVCPALYDRTIVINGVAKAYAMTGWRIGYAAGPAKIIASMKKIQSQSTSNPASISQHAAKAALLGDQNCVAVMTEAYKERHDYLISKLQKMPGIQCIPSDGTFYTFPSVKALLSGTELKTDLAFAEFLLHEADIAVVPGSAFGTEGHIRISYATKMENLHEAVARLEKAIAKLAL